jgi:hypothetical protein
MCNKNGGVCSDDLPEAESASLPCATNVFFIKRE